MQKPAMWILWSSFLAACVGEMVFFAIFDPHDLLTSWHSAPPSRITIYSVGFFFFWLLTGMASGLTWVLTRPAEEVNR